MGLASATTVRRKRLSEGVESLGVRYWRNFAVEDLMRDLTALIDELVLDAWQQHLGAHSDVAYTPSAATGVKCILADVICWYLQRG